MNLNGKSVLVTGGGSGIGAAIALAFARAGAQVVISGRNADKLEAVASEVNEGRIQFQVCDVSDRDAANDLVEHAQRQFGHIDIVVNAAGINVPNRLMENLDPADWDRMLAVNATGTFNVIQAVLPQMRRRNDGLIININSVSGLRPGMLGGVGYNASKFAVTALTHSVAQEVKNDGIRVTNLCPGEVDTPILEQRPQAVTEEHRARILRPEDIAQVALSLAYLPPRVHVPEVIVKPTFQDYF